MERPLDEERRDLKERVLSMGALVERMLVSVIRCLIDRDSNRALDVLELEKTVNQFHVDLDERSIRILALRHPVAEDLRFLFASMKIISDLERMADQLVNIAQTADRYLFKVEPVEEIAIVFKMAEIAHPMLKDSLHAFAASDLEAARRVLDNESGLDELKRDAVAKLVDLIRLYPERSAQYVDIILISKNLERLGDHATNIAEDVIFTALGADVRHLARPPALQV